MKTKTLIYNNPYSSKSKNKTIFLICGMENFKPIGLKRTFGWFLKLQDAIDCVENNTGDLHECAYRYIVVEEVMEGVWGIGISERWFKFDEKQHGFYQIPKPEETNNIINWSLG